MWSGWVQGNSNGPLVPMEKHPIPMVLLVTMHLIKGTYIILSCGLAGYRAIPMVHWYTCQLFLRYKCEIFILGVLGFLKTTRSFPKIPEEV